MEVLQLSDYRIPPPEKTKAKSQYERYPLPFFNRGKRCTWDVTPSGNYSVDCDTGQAFAIEFLKSCDKTNGWASLMQSIVADMSSARLPDFGTAPLRGYLAPALDISTFLDGRAESHSVVTKTPRSDSSASSRSNSAFSLSGSASANLRYLAARSWLVGTHLPTQ
jgi:hypothetical protein